MNRRNFLKTSAVAGGAVAYLRSAAPAVAAPQDLLATRVTPAPAKLPDLQPARWLWYPSGRCLQNTFVLFRRELTLTEKPVRATGWICADSRYLLEVNGRRIQWGPAPCDPRWQEADPLDLTAALAAGRNVLAATVLFYGVGDGTWPVGKPGFLFWLEMEYADGRKEKVVSDAGWKTLLARAWPAGHYKRWYLRALQEEFDARQYPYGWQQADYQPDANWLPAMTLGGSPNLPSVCTNYYEYQLDIGGQAGACELRPRSVPMLQEYAVPAQQLAESAWLEWRRAPEEYFACRTPEAFQELRQPAARPAGDHEWTVNLEGQNRGAVLTFEFKEQIVGWPYFTIEAPAGTVVELLVHEAHQPGGPVLLNSHFDSWSRFICRPGVNRFETFDFESLRWLQLHIHGAMGAVRVREVGVRRRIFPWPNQPVIRVGESGLQRLLDASLNTLHNCAQETCVDGMGRERQQYSGDGGHQLQAIRWAFGEWRLPARFLATFSQGQTLDGFFLDCWPAYDRLARLMERQLQLTGWGPLLDHGVGFNFDCWLHYLHTGNFDAVKEPYPRLLKFAAYLKRIVGADGLLPVEDLGIPSVWIDHIAYQKQRHKQCAFNLYAAAAMEHALAPLARAFGDTRQAREISDFGQSLLKAAVRKFWNPSDGLFIVNLPWLGEEKGRRLCDRSLATAVLFDQCPGRHTAAAINALAKCPPEMGFSYPANAGWRLQALGKAGRADVIISDFRKRWATMDSVRLNNTLQEDWRAAPDSGAQWSHCAVIPIFVLYQHLAGIRPLTPGFARCEIRPQLGDLERVELAAHTPRGPIGFKAEGRLGDRTIEIALPPGCEAELVVRREEELRLKPLPGLNPEGHLRYQLPAGQTTRFTLRRS